MSCSTSSSTIRALAVLALLCLLGGCAKTEPSAEGDSPRVATPTGQSSRSPRNTPNEPITATDPCAFRLHDISGQLLLYYAINRRLPANLAELLTLPGGNPNLPLTCPVSNKPYLYAPGGVSVPKQVGSAILFDPDPSHSGHHWAVIIAEPAEQQPLVSRVVAVQPGQLPR